MYTAYWVNPDGSHPKTTLAYISSSSSSDTALLLTGDIDAYTDTEAHAVVEAVSRFCLSVSLDVTGARAGVPVRVSSGGCGVVLLMLGRYADCCGGVVLVIQALFFVGN